MNGQSQPYQLLTSENAALVLVDHQVGLMTGVRDYSTGELKHNVVALAKASESMWGADLP
jgi:nicotinamidase-related amidase